MTWTIKSFKRQRIRLAMYMPLKAMKILCKVWDPNFLKIIEFIRQQLISKLNAGQICFPRIACYE